MAWNEANWLGVLTQVLLVPLLVPYIKTTVKAAISSTLRFTTPTFPPIRIYQNFPERKLHSNRKQVFSSKRISNYELAAYFFLGVPGLSIGVPNLGE